MAPRLSHDACINWDVRPRPPVYLETAPVLLTGQAVTERLRCQGADPTRSGVTCRKLLFLYPGHGGPNRRWMPSRRADALRLSGSRMTNWQGGGDLATGERTYGPIFLTRRWPPGWTGMVPGGSFGGQSAAPGSPSRSGPIPCVTRSSLPPWMPMCRCGMSRKPPPP